MTVHTATRYAVRTKSFHSDAVENFKDWLARQTNPNAGRWEYDAKKRRGSYVPYDHRKILDENNFHWEWIASGKSTGTSPDFKDAYMYSDKKLALKAAKKATEHHLRERGREDFEVIEVTTTFVE